MNFIKKNLAAVTMVLVLVLGGGFLVANQTKQPAKTETKSSVQKNTSVAVKITADGVSKDYTVKDGVGKTALEVTKSATSDIKMTGEGANAFITSINGRVASSDKKEYWKLVINGQDAQVGAGSYTVKENDKISWEIATY